MKFEFLFAMWIIALAITLICNVTIVRDYKPMYGIKHQHKPTALISLLAVSIAIEVGLLTFSLWQLLNWDITK